jgi:hypothetical protein
LLQDNDEKLGNERLLKMAKGVASGMDYLSTIGFVHRVRTLLLLLKINFGLLFLQVLMLT